MKIIQVNLRYSEIVVSWLEQENINCHCTFNIHSY
jgi:hypothetical protein